ncbi:MAG: hypothetical protein AB1551_08805 [Actinomycetota bacterium]
MKLMETSGEKESLRVAYADVLRYLGETGRIYDPGENPEPMDKEGALDVEIEDTLKGMQPYLDAVRTLARLRGYHEVLKAAERGKDDKTHLAEWAREELKTLDSEGKDSEARVEQARRKVQDMETTNEVQRRRLQALLKLRGNDEGFLIL